jgi:glycosyltransferase involved in cell wall biosynthesis
MKIGIDANVLMDKHYSGVSKYAANLLTALLEFDQKNEYSLFYNSWRAPFNKLSSWKRKNCQLKGTRFPSKIYNYLLQKILHYPKIDKYLGNTEIFFAPHFNFISLSKDVKFVITVHDISFLRYPDFFSKRKNFWHRALPIKKLLERANMIVAVSQSTKDDLVELLNLPPEKIRVIYSGNNSDVPVVKKLKEANAYLEKNKINSRFILFVGNIEPRKNIINLIKAYNILRQEKPELNDVQLIIAGAPGWKHKKIFTSWKQSPFKDDIKFLGYIDKYEKEYLYQTASVFVYPSFYEGFGFPPLEAMSYSLPVVSSNVSSLPEVLGNSALLVNPYKSEEIKEAIFLAITNDKLREILINRGRKKALEYTWSKTAKQYFNLFQELKEK